jgi:RIO-like serine/threonine protein kinase
MMEKLKGHDFDLLERIFRSQKVSSVFLIEKLKQHGELTVEEIEEIVDIISDELMQYGLMENYEPNEYGRVVDDLLGKVNMMSPRHYAES